MNFAVDIHQYPVCCESLGAMTGDRVAVIEVPHLVGIEADRFAVVHLYGKRVVLAAMSGCQSYVST